MLLVLNWTDHFKFCIKNKKRKTSIKKTVCEIMNFDSPKLTKIKKKSRNTTKCHNIFTIPSFSAMVSPNMIFYYFILEKCYLHYIFTTNFRWQIVISIKLGPLLISLLYPSIISYHLEFAMKLSWKCWELSIFLYL